MDPLKAVVLQYTSCFFFLFSVSLERRVTRQPFAVALYCFEVYSLNNFGMIFSTLREGFDLLPLLSIIVSSNLLHFHLPVSQRQD